MRCTKEFTLNIVEADMPLDQAIYSAANAVIYGCRGAYVYSFNKDTGAKIAEARVVESWGKSCIAYDNSRDLIYFAGNDDPAYYYNDVTLDDNVPFKKAIYKVTAATLAVAGSIAWNKTGAGFQAFGGYRSINHIGYSALHDILWYSYQLDAGSTGSSFDMQNLSPVAASELYHNAGAPKRVTSGNILRDVCYDETQDRHWLAQDGQVELSYWDGGVSYFKYEMRDLWFTTFAQSHDGIGVCADTLTGKGYFATGTQAVYVLTPGTDPMTFATFNLGDAAANPSRCKFWPEQSKVYFPSPADNKVYIYDIAGASVTVKTGFDFPFDVVFTPTKAFAVQKSKQGLKEIV